MLRSTILLVTALLFNSCASSTLVGSRDFSKEPYLSVSTPHSSGHGCPVRDDLFVTARHIVQPSFKEINYVTWGTVNNEQWGAASIFKASLSQDLVLMRIIDQKLQRWYPIGNPIPHQRHYGWEFTFDTDNPSDTFRRKLRSSMWLREFAGNIVLNEPATPGASGSCLFNELGQAVGIIVKSSPEFSTTLAVRFMFSQTEIDAFPRIWK